MIIDPYYLGKLGHCYTVRAKKTGIQEFTGFFLSTRLPNTTGQRKTVPINEDLNSGKKDHPKGRNENSQGANSQGNIERLMEEEIHEYDAYVVLVTSYGNRDCRANVILIN